MREEEKNKRKNHSGVNDITKGEHNVWVRKLVPRLTEWTQLWDSRGSNEINGRGFL